MRYATRLAWIGIGVVVVLFLVAGLAVASFLGYIGGSTEVTPKGNFSIDQARRFPSFPVFYAGDEVNGNRLTAILRESLGPDRKDQQSVGFIYGTCDVGPGFDPGGCAPPVEISNEPACARNLDMYGGAVRRTTIRGASAGVLEGGSHLEIQTGKTTVVIFADSKQKALSVARHLRGVNVDVAPADSLPPAAPGALVGEVRCP